MKCLKVPWETMAIVGKPMRRAFQTRASAWEFAKDLRAFIEEKKGKTGKTYYSVVYSQEHIEMSMRRIYVDDWNPVEYLDAGELSWCIYEE